MFSSRTSWHLKPNRFARALDAHRRSGKQLLDLTASNPTTCGFLYPKYAILDGLADVRALEYKPESKGLAEAREAVAQYYAEKQSLFGALERMDAERIVLTSGTSEAYNHVFRLMCEPADEVLVPAPSYPLLEFLGGLADVRLVPYPLLYDETWRIDLRGLRAALTPRSRCIVVVHPNNPTGSLVKPREAQELMQICEEKKLAIVADEVFLGYSDDADAAPSFAVAKGALTFTLSGLSKISALPQMKLAWIAVSGPEEQTRAAIERLEIIADTFLSPSTPVQLATGKFLAVRSEMQGQLKQRIAENLSLLDHELRGMRGVTRLRREGGWYAVLHAPARDSDESLAVELLERFSVLVHPGSFFDFAQEGFLVLSLIAPVEDFHEGVRRMGGFFRA